MLYAARHGTARHGTARQGTAGHGTARHGTAQHSTAQQSRLAACTLACHLSSFALCIICSKSQVRCQKLVEPTPQCMLVYISFTWMMTHEVRYIQIDQPPTQSQAAGQVAQHKIAAMMGKESAKAGCRAKVDSGKTLYTCEPSAHDLMHSKIGRHNS